MKPRKLQSEIFDAAIQEFAAQGYEKTTMDTIAERLSMTKGNLYLYAEGKKDLYENAIRYGLKKWMNTVADEIAEITSSTEKFRKICRASYYYLKKEEPLRRILQRDQSIFPVKSDDDRFSDINTVAMKLLEKTIEEGIKSGVFRAVNPAETARYFYSVYIMFIIKTYVKCDTTADDKLFETAVELNLYSIDAGLSG